MSAIGALLGLFLVIFLIVKRYNPAYSLIFGALVGGLVGGFSLTETVDMMITGIKDITPAIIRIITAGVLTGVLIKSGAAVTIADTIIERMGSNRVLFAIALSTMILCAVGVFIDVAVITVAPIALVVSSRSGYSKMKVLLAMIGGGKCGNIISPNPNTIIAAENLNVNLFSVMTFNLLPAILGLVFVVVLLKFFPNRGERVDAVESLKSDHALPKFSQAVVAPLVVILLLSLRPLFDVNIDPLFALPVGGIVGLLAMGKLREVKESIVVGLDKMSPVAILLVGTGTIAGIIKNSALKEYLLAFLDASNISELYIAPISGILMSAATASTTAGATIASASFGQAIVASGISGVVGAAMINAGATVLDHLPHGSFFHATAGASGVNMSERLRLIPYESLVGFVLTFLSVLMSWVVVQF